jgi:NAD(P)-dependent dehydrogenase (short-subunit alcohol dehydrogenase family)
MRLKNKVIVVTGGNGLLGKAYINKITEDGGLAVNADINSGIDLSNFQHTLDITSEESIKLLIKNISEKYGQIHGWVNNAYPKTKDWGIKFEDEPFSSWRQNIDMHLNGYVLCCKLVSEHMKIFNNGSIINLASIYGMQGPDFTVYDGTNMGNPAGYSAIKGGIINFTKYLASYYGKYNIRVNCVSPGGIFDNQNEIFVANFSKKTPLKRMGNPDDVSPAISFLLSDESKYITGHNLVVDGGWSII